MGGVDMNKGWMTAVLGLSFSIATFAQSAPPTALPDSVLFVISNAPALTKEELAFRNIYQLNSAMETIFDKDLKVVQKNLRDRVPVIMGLFNAAGGRFILYRPGQLPLEAPPVPPIYQIAKATAHSALASRTHSRARARARRGRGLRSWGGALYREVDWARSDSASITFL